MDELPRHARDLLALAREADEPSVEDRERVRKALAVALTASAATAAGSVASHASASSAMQVGVRLGAKTAWLASTAGKLAVTGGVIAALGTTALWLRPAASP